MLVFYSIGPTELTRGTVIVFRLSLVAHAATLGTLFPANDSLIPTVTDTMIANGDLANPVVAISFEPSEFNDSFNGEITWGQSSFPQSSKFPCSLF